MNLAAITAKLSAAYAERAYIAENYGSRCHAYGAIGEEIYKLQEAQRLAEIAERRA